MGNKSKVVLNLKLDGKKVVGLFGCCVYAWIRKNKYLYVGCTSCGIKRIANHNTINKIEKFLSTDKLLFWFFNDYFSALKEENNLIQKFSPVYNIAGKDTHIPNHLKVRKEVKCICCGKTFMQSRWWQKYCNVKCSSSRTSDWSSERETLSFNN